MTSSRCSPHSSRATVTNALYDNGLPIHAIWRRSVTNDVLDHWDESQDLIEAVRHEAVALIGSFAGHLVHDKQIFEVLRHPKTKAILTPEEKSAGNMTLYEFVFLGS